MQPDRRDYFPDARTYISFEEGFIGEHRLNYWYIPAQENKIRAPHSRGLVIQVHGNAQNLSSHIRSVGWLTSAGYDVATFDYRGFGKTEGRKGLDRAYEDVQIALDFFTLTKNPKHLPVFFYGQSLGGTLMLKAISSQPKRWHPALVIIESSFYSYQQIAREKLASTWLTWPFQWLAYLLVTDHLSLKADELHQVSPSILFYSQRDPIVPVHNGEEIFADLAEPKKLYLYPEPGHVAAMWVQEGKFRRLLVETMNHQK